MNIRKIIAKIKNKLRICGMKNCKNKIYDEYHLDEFFICERCMLKIEQDLFF